MALYFIKDTTLTGIAQAIRDKTGSEDRIAVSEMATKIGEIETGGMDVEIATETLLEETTLTFAVSSISGHYVTMYDYITNPSFKLEVGKTYIVLWDGKEYMRIATEYTDGTNTYVMLGSQYLFEYTDDSSGEPFCLRYNASNNQLVLYTYQQDNHTVGIFEMTGNSGTTSEKVVLSKTGSFTSTGLNTVTHGLGVVPFAIFVFSKATSTKAQIISMWSLSPSAWATSNTQIRVPYGSGWFNINKYDFTQSYDSDSTEYLYGVIREVNANTFVIGSSATVGSTVSGQTYQYLVLGYST